MDCPVTKYCVSMLSMITGKMVNVGIKAHTASWNHHRIPGTELVIITFMVIIPNVMAEENNCTVPIQPSLVPSVDEAAHLYAASGGHLSPVASFGSDPLANSSHLVSLRQQAMDENIPTPEELFSAAVNGTICTSHTIHGGYN